MRKAAGCARIGACRCPHVVSSPVPCTHKTPRLSPTPLRPPKALKANAEGAVKELRLNANYITRFGQVALSEAVDMVYEMAGGRTTTVSF